jgi:hypothetical protein
LPGQQIDGFEHGMEAGRMPYAWPEHTDFASWELDVVDRDCPSCGRMMHICDHRYRHLHTLEGPVQLVCKLNHCPDRTCPGHVTTKSPEPEITIALPRMAIGWDVFCWIGHRRCSRHWSVPLIRGELQDDFGIKLSADAIENYIRSYQVMLAARQQDPEMLRREYESVDEIILTIDGLQPEKGHETLYVVRELTQKRVWFAEPLISATADEVRRLIAKAKEWAESLDKPVVFWLSDRQDAFVTGIALEFPDTPHRYCANHFLRDVAKPVLEADSHAKVQMRREVRGLRKIEQAVLKRQKAEAMEDLGPEDPRATVTLIATSANVPSSAVDSASTVVLDYCAAVRGILNDDQGGPLHPPSLRMADALNEVRESIQRNLDEQKGGFAEEQLGRLAGCITKGLDKVEEQQATIREYVGVIAEVAATLHPGTEDCMDRQEKFEELIDQFEQTDDPIRHHMATVMLSFLPGLFVGDDEYEELKDNLDLERWFRLPKSHERRIHGHRHAGIRIVLEGPTLVHALDAHAGHPQPFTAEDLVPYRDAREPQCQSEARNRRTIMRKARSKKTRSALLAELERRYRESP